MLFSIGLFGLIWTTLPQKPNSQVIQLNPILYEVKLNGYTESVTLLSGYEFILSKPEKIIFGDEAHIELILQPNSEIPLDKKDQISIEGNLLVLLAAQLDLSNAISRPQNLVVEPISPNGKVSFFWQVKPNQMVNTKGTLWVYLQIKPIGNELSLESIPLLALPLELEYLRLLGMSLNGFRWVIGLILLSIILVISLYMCNKKEEIS
ncbi:MAG: hypothetical protein JEZ06_14590 [Anaerolineaceae bacterium]|nr:hypothetical protein [Anaerolineaceae bacterium]